MKEYIEIPNSPGMKVLKDAPSLEKPAIRDAVTNVHALASE
jgi:hypothetical protein